MDCACCNGKPGFTQSTSGDTGSVAALWRSTFSVKLDAMHLMLRIGREMNAEHPRRKKFLIDLSHAIFVQHEDDLKDLMRARKAAGFKGPPTRVERVKFIRRVVGEPESVAERMILVLKAHRELDSQCRSQAEAVGMEVDNITVADIAYPLITQRVMAVYQQQLVHVRNGCISDDPENLPYVRVGTTNYHSTGHHLAHYQSLRGTSKVEAVHSVLDRTFYTQRGIGAEVFDARLGWWMLGYNRRRLRALGKKVPPDSMPPKVCEHYIAHGLCTEFPDWSIAAAGSEDSVKIGYEYGRMVTGEEQEIELDLNEEVVQADGDHEVPDPLEEKAVVVTSVEALLELDLEAVDLVDDAPSFFEATPQDREMPSTSANVLEDMDVPQPEFQTDSTLTATDDNIPTDDSTTADADWKSAPLPLPDTTPGRRRNVSRLRAMGGDPVCVPPDFNGNMLAIWEELWHSMPQSGKVSATVNSLLLKYKERCTTERKRAHDFSRSPAPLLPVSFALAKDWLLKQQKAQSEALQTGGINRVAQEVIANLASTLAEQPISTAALLEQPPRPASPVVLSPVMSTGPDRVTDQERVEECAEAREGRSATYIHQHLLERKRSSSHLSLRNDSSKHMLACLS
jgi:hypothetical protein